VTDPKVTLRCAECHVGTLVERVNKQNGGHFMGCSAWPECQHTEPVPAYLLLKRAGAAQLPGMEEL
jgi:ssDNA-binding Zn-finger/Zn-ribbon topoisomerase 1